MKNEDAVAAIDYLLTRDDVDAARIFGAGVCQGGPEMLDIASYDDRIKAVASVTGYYRDRETDLFMIAAGVSENPFDPATAPTTAQLESCLPPGSNVPAMPRRDTSRRARLSTRPWFHPISVTPSPDPMRDYPVRWCGAGTDRGRSRAGRTATRS